MKSARKKKRPLPGWYLAQPPEVRGVAFFHEAYRDLTTCRLVDMGPIPWTAARTYARDKHLPRDVADVLWAVVQRMDNAERAWRLEQLKQESGGV